MSADWKASLSFSDRLALIVKLTAAYKDAHPTTDSKQATQYARSVETKAFNDAISLVDYRVRCETVVQDLESSVLTPSCPKIPTSESVAAQIIQKCAATAKFGRWKQAAHFKDGLFSEVFVAQAPETNPESYTGKPSTYVALKVTHLAAMVAPHNSEREVRILRRTAGPNVIALWESFYDGAGHLVLVLPFLPLTLEQIIHEGRPFDVGTKACLKDLFKALAHIHSIGVIHRDVKPSNILLDSPDGPALLSDFGIAWSPTDPASEPPNKKITDVGTTCYRPPEVLFGSTAYDTSFDLWAAGCVVAEVIRGDGKPLFESGDLGTDLTLVLSIFQSLGTPNAEVWPELSSMPDWGKINFHEHPPKPWSELLPGLPEDAKELVGQLVQYSGGRRLRADLTLDHKFFAE